MAIGRTFKEALQKALRGSRPAGDGFGNVPASRPATPRTPPRSAPRDRVPNRPHDWRARCALGLSVEEIHERTKIDPWFLDQIAEIIEHERSSRRASNGLDDRRPGAAARPSAWASPTRSSPPRAAAAEAGGARARARAGVARSTSASTPAPPSSRRHALPLLDLRRGVERGRARPAAR
jgi:hypothetical protein